MKSPIFWQGRGSEGKVPGSVLACVYRLSMIVLGIETSCDETAAAVVDADRRILSNIVLSQLEAHAPYGGVVPEIAARAHVEAVDDVVAQAMYEAGAKFTDLSCIAATGGPGLIGGVIVGVMTAKAIALAEAKPFVAVNHLEAHALTARLSGTESGEVVAFPYQIGKQYTMGEAAA